MAACIVLAGVACAAPVQKDFSARVIATSNGTQMESKMYVSQGKVRVENGRTVTISREDRNIVYMLLPDQRGYVEMPMPQQGAAPGMGSAAGEVSRTLVGEEVIDGQATEKYRIVYQVGASRQAILTWQRKGTQVPVRTATEDMSVVTDYKDMVFASQPAELFEIPAGYHKISMSMPSMDQLTGAAESMGQPE